MQFEFGKAPMHYVEGIPAYKAGEWEGKSSCKFGPTRKVIRTKSEGIIFNEKEPLIIPKRRTYNILPTKEKEFRPSIKMVKQVLNHGIAESRIKIITPVITIGKDRPEKVHYFQYREDMLKTQQEHDTNSTSKQILGDEFKVLNQIGFGKKTLENLPNNKLLNLNFSKDFNTYNFNNNTKSSNDKKERVVLDKVAKCMWQKQQNEQMMNMRIEKENQKKDTEYVKKLDTWEKNFLPKIK